MSFFDSQVSVFKITDTGSTLRDVSASIVSIEGLPGPRELNEATPLNQAGHKYHPTLENGPINLEVIFDDTANTGSDTVFGPLRTHTAAVAFEYYPKGGSSPKYSGNCWVRNYSIQTRVGSLLTARVELQVDGQVTRTAS
jgi:hypothetical protein